MASDIGENGGFFNLSLTRVALALMQLVLIAMGAALCYLEACNTFYNNMLKLPDSYVYPPAITFLFGLYIIAWAVFCMFAILLDWELCGQFLFIELAIGILPAVVAASIIGFPAINSGQFSQDYRIGLAKEALNNFPIAFQKYNDVSRSSNKCCGFLHVIELATTPGELTSKYCRNEIQKISPYIQMTNAVVQLKDKYVKQAIVNATFDLFNPMASFIDPVFNVNYISELLDILVKYEFPAADRMKGFISKIMMAMPKDRVDWFLFAKEKPDLVEDARRTYFGKDFVFGDLLEKPLKAVSESFTGCSQYVTSNNQDSRRLFMITVLVWIISHLTTSCAFHFGRLSRRNDSRPVMLSQQVMPQPVKPVSNHRR